jgi:hypothetical protein
LTLIGLYFQHPENFFFLSFFFYSCFKVGSSSNLFFTNFFFRLRPVAIDVQRGEIRNVKNLEIKKEKEKEKATG